MSRGLVLLTGASGFLGSHIASQLLDTGYSVTATFRNEAKAVSFLEAFPRQAVKAHIVPDITKKGAYDECIVGADYVIHCASPYTFNIKDIQKDLLDPAIQGTSRMLEAIASCITVKRLVLTSSFASVIDPVKGPRAGYSYTENDWNPLTPEKALESNIFGYQASKTFAERAAWDFITSRSDKEWPTLVTICPPLIFGPVHLASRITLNSINESSSQLLNAVNSADSAAAPTRMPVFADVRDVAKAHVKALDAAKVPQSERFLVCGGKFTWAAIREIARTGACSPEALAPADDFYSLNTDKVEKMMEIQWHRLDACVQDCLDSLGVKARI